MLTRTYPDNRVERFRLLRKRPDGLHQSPIRADVNADAGSMAFLPLDRCMWADYPFVITGEPTSSACAEAKAESVARERGRPIEPAPGNAGEGISLPASGRVSLA